MQSEECVCMSSRPNRKRAACDASVDTEVGEAKDGLVLFRSTTFTINFENSRSAVTAFCCSFRIIVYYYSLRKFYTRIDVSDDKLFNTYVRNEDSEIVHHQPKIGTYVEYKDILL